MCTRSFPDNPMLADNRAPLLHLLDKKLSLFFGTGEQFGNLHVLDELLVENRFPQRLDQRCPETVDDRLRRSPGREYAPPGVGFESREAAFERRRHVSKRSDASLAGLHHSPKSPGCDLG